MMMRLPREAPAANRSKPGCSRPTKEVEAYPQKWGEIEVGTYLDWAQITVRGRPRCQLDGRHAKRPNICAHSVGHLPAASRNLHRIGPASESFVICNAKPTLQAPGGQMIPAACNQQRRIQNPQRFPPSSGLASGHPFEACDLVPWSGQILPIAPVPPQNPS